MTCRPTRYADTRTSGGLLLAGEIHPPSMIGELVPRAGTPSWCGE